MIDAAIAGGGPAGAMAAALLARAGRQVVLLERDHAPADRICGEFLSREALEDIDRLGIDPWALGAEPIEAVRLVRGRMVAEAALPFRGASLSRRVLDAALLHAAAGFGAEIRRGAGIRALEHPSASGMASPTASAARTAGTEGGAGTEAWQGALALEDGSTLRARTLLLATGKHELRGARRQLRRPPPKLVGFKTYLALAPAQARALQGHVEVMLFPGAYAGLQPVEGGRANLCLLAAQARLEAAGGRWEALLAALCRDGAHLAERLDGARPLLPRPLTIARVPYGFVHAGPDLPGLYRVGDQMAVIPSFCGDGIAIALHSGAAAARAVLAGEGAAAHHRRMRRDAGGPVRLATLLYAVAQSAAGQRLLAGAFRAWPGGLRLVAGLTRVR